MVGPFFIFKNKSSKYLDIVIKYEWLPPVVRARDEVEIIEVPGRDGYLTIPKDRKEPVIKKVKGILINEDKKVEVRRWLQGKGKLILSNDRDVFYFAQIINPVEFYDYWTYGWEFEIEFLCQPYGYLHEGQRVVTINKQKTVLHNPTDEVAKPLIKIYGSGDVDLIINNNINKFNIDGYVEIDSELMESYKDNSLVVFAGDFPKLKAGENVISWNGAVEKIEIIPRWRR